MSTGSLSMVSGPDKEFWGKGRVPVLAIVVVGAAAGLLIVFGQWIYALSLVIVALVVRWPVEIALGSLAFLLPFDSVSAVGAEASGVALTRYVAGLAACALLAVGLATRRLATPPRAALWWSLFVAWGSVTMAWAEAPELAWERLPTALSLLVLFLAATSFRISTRELSAVAVLAILGGCCAALMASSQFYSGTFFHETWRSSLMIAGRETDPNQFAASLLLPLSLGVGGVMLAKSRFLRTGSMLAVITVSLALLLTMSRGSIIAALAIVGVYMYRFGVNRRVMAALACFALLLLFMPQSFFARLALEDRGAGRFDIWAASLGLLPHYGIFGAGWNNFIVVYTNIAGDAPKFHGYTEGSHNIYLGMTIEVGIIGVVFLLSAFRSQLREVRQRIAVPYEAACWAMLVMGITLDIIWRKSFWMPWILLAMAVRARDGKETEAAL